MSGTAPHAWDSGNEEVEQRQCIDGSYTHQVVKKRSGGKIEGRRGGTMEGDRFDLKVQRRKDRSA